MGQAVGSNNKEKNPLLELRDIAKKTTDDIGFLAFDTSKKDSTFSCNRCKAPMLQDHRIATSVLLFQFLKCSCHIGSYHFQVRDMRITDEKVNLLISADHLRKKQLNPIGQFIYQMILCSTNSYQKLCGLVGEGKVKVRPDLLVAKDRLDQMKWDCERYFENVLADKANTDCNDLQFYRIWGILKGNDEHALKYSLQEVNPKRLSCKIGTWMMRYAVKVVNDLSQSVLENIEELNLELEALPDSFQAKFKQFTDHMNELRERALSDNFLIRMHEQYDESELIAVIGNHKNMAFEDFKQVLMDSRGKSNKSIAKYGASIQNQIIKAAAAFGMDKNSLQSRAYSNDIRVKLAILNTEFLIISSMNIDFDHQVIHKYLDPLEKKLQQLVDKHDDSTAQEVARLCCRIGISSIN